MAIPFNVPSDEQPESEWVVQFQMIFKRNILNLLNEMALIRDNTATYPDRLPDSSTVPTDQPRTETDNLPVVPSTTVAAAVENARTNLDWTFRQSTGSSSERRNTNLNLHILLSSTLNSRNGTVLAAVPTHAESARRSRRQRTSSESSCCEEAKNGTLPIENAEETVEPAQRDWTQVGAFLRQIADDFQAASLKEEDAEPSRRPKERCKEENSSLFSKIMPASIKSSIWTAVICVIGWHLFRAR